MMRPDSRRNALLAIVYLLLLVLAVPWYWPADETRLVLGMPIWVVTAILVGFVTACLTAWILLSRPWPESVNDEEKHE
jgi:hypothetical protein